MSRIDLVLCDVGNVLILANHSLTHEYLIARGVDPDRAATFFTNEEWRNFSRGLISGPEAYRRLIRDYLDNALDYQTIVAAHDVHMYAVDQAVALTLREIRRPLAFATDTNCWQTRRERELIELRQFSDLIIRSDDPDIRGLKADPGTWERILERLRLDPGQILFIDDSPDKIAQANAAGIDRTIHFTDARRLSTELKRCGLI